MIQEIVRKPLRPSVEPLKKSMKFLISQLPSKRRGLMNVTKIDTLLANRLGKAVVEFPSHHAGYVSHPRAFADQLSAVLTAPAKQEG